MSRVDTAVLPAGVEPAGAAVRRAGGSDKNQSGSGVVTNSPPGIADWQDGITAGQHLHRSGSTKRIVVLS